MLMPRIIRRKQSGQAAGLILFLIGLIILLAVFWKSCFLQSVCQLRDELSLLKISVIHLS